MRLKQQWVCQSRRSTGASEWFGCPATADRHPPVAQHMMVVHRLHPGCPPEPKRVFRCTGFCKQAPSYGPHMIWVHRPYIRAAPEGVQMLLQAGTHLCPRRSRGFSVRSLSTKSLHSSETSQSSSDGQLRLRSRMLSKISCRCGGRTAPQLSRQAAELSAELRSAAVACRPQPLMQRRPLHLHTCLLPCGQSAQQH